MAIQSIPNRIYFPPMPDDITGPPTLTPSTTFDITALNGYAAYVGQMPETSTFDTVFFKVGSVGAGNKFLARVAIEAISATNGLPVASPNNLLYPGASGSIIIQNAGDYAVRLASPVTVPRGQIFSITIAAVSAALVNACRISEFGDDEIGTGFPYCLNAEAGTPAFVFNIAPCLGLALTGVSGIPIPHLWPFTDTPVTDSFKSPEMRGNKITLRSTMRAAGATVYGNVDTVSSMVILYDADGKTPIASVPWYPGLPNNSTSYKLDLLFPTSVTLSADTYYLAVSGGTTGLASNTTLYYATFPEEIWRKASPLGGQDVMYVSTSIVPNNTNSWTQQTTRQMFLGLIIDGLDDGVKVGAGETSCVFAT